VERARTRLEREMAMVRLREMGQRTSNQLPSQVIKLTGSTQAAELAAGEGDTAAWTAADGTATEAAGEAAAEATETAA
jgi:hypothetical protein